MNSALAYLFDSYSASVTQTANHKKRPHKGAAQRPVPASAATGYRHSQHGFSRSGISDQVVENSISVGKTLVRRISHEELSQVHLAIFSEQYYCFPTAYLFHFSCRFFVLAVRSVTCSIECAARQKQTLRQRTFPTRKCGFFVIGRFLNVPRRTVIPAEQTCR